MADVFSHIDTRILLRNKHILFLGDSNIRAQYKDLVWLLNSNTLISKTSLKTRLERSYLGDSLLSGNILDRGRSYQEARKYFDQSCDTTVEFMFIARCYNDDLKTLFSAYKNLSRKVPDVVVINSCLWDLTRWGPNGVPMYKDNMVKLMRLISQCLPPATLVIWTTALPAASHVAGGLIIKQIEFMQPLLRFEVMEANTFARELVVSHGFDVIDNHYHMRMQMHRRAKDGVHYTQCPVRLMTNLLLTHLALSWGHKLPGKVTSVLLNKAIMLDNEPLKQEAPVKMPTTGIFSKINLVSPVLRRTKGIKITVDQSGTNRKCDIVVDEEELSDFPNPRIFHKRVVEFPDSLEIQNERGYPLRRYWDIPPLPQVLPTFQQQPSRNSYRRKRNKKYQSLRNNPYRNQWFK